MSNVLKFNYFFCKFRWFVILWTQISFFGTVHYYNTINNILIAFQRRRWIQSFAVRVTLWPNKFTFVTQVSIFRPKFRSFYRRHVLPVRKLALFNCRHISLLLRLRFCLLWLNSVPPGLYSPDFDIPSTDCLTYWRQYSPASCLFYIKLRFTCVPKLQDRHRRPSKR